MKLTYAGLRATVPMTKRTCIGQNHMPSIDVVGGTARSMRFVRNGRKLQMEYADAVKQAYSQTSKRIYMQPLIRLTVFCVELVLSRHPSFPVPLSMERKHL